MPPKQVTVVTGSRLHFGLLGVGAVPRSFGGVGLMVEAPSLRLTAQLADAWSAEGPCGKRALTFAQRFAESVARARPARIVLAAGPREHVGLGSGTQLALAVAKALAALYGLPEFDAVELARRVGRGARSGLGVHGFAHGGFLVDGGKGPTTTVAPLIARHDFPEEWQIVLAYPGGTGLAGEAEGRAFDQLADETTPEQTDRLCTLALKGILPALVERDFQSFGEALHEFNRRAGEMFSARQGGVYASPRTADLVRFTREQGVHGVGQSSWGPTVFAVVEAERAMWLRGRISETFNLGAQDVAVTGATNRGARAYFAEG